jgi:hypothetical protein
LSSDPWEKNWVAGDVKNWEQSSVGIFSDRCQAAENGENRWYLFESRDWGKSVFCVSAYLENDTLGICRFFDE